MAGQISAAPERIWDEAALRKLRAVWRSECGEQCGARGGKPLPLEGWAELVHALGARVSYGDFSGGPEDHLLRLTTLPEFEESVRELTRLWSDSQLAKDEQTAGRLRKAARRARRRALLIWRNPRVKPALREEKQEMAEWLLLWLQMPESFPEWMELRMRTEAYQQLRRLRGSEAAAVEGPQEGSSGEKATGLEKDSGQL